MTAAFYVPAVPVPDALTWVLLVCGLIGLGFAIVAMAESKRVAVRNVLPALLFVLAVFWAAPMVLCCWCPADPTWLECVLQPWCCL